MSARRQKSRDRRRRPPGEPRSETKPPGRGPAARGGAGLTVIAGAVRIERRIPALLLTGASLAALCLIFPPIGWWPLAYVCLTPWLICVCTMRRARFVYFVSYLLGLCHYLIMLNWIAPVTPPGYAAMCIYFAVFFPLAAWPLRHMYRHRGISVALAAPVVWVAVEYLRSISTLGFPFLLMAHSHYRVLSMIQISDLVGAYGVTFVLVMVNGWFADLIIQPIRLRRTDRLERRVRMPLGSLATVLVVLATLIYGAAQRSKSRARPGPTVAVVQGDFEMYVDDRRHRTPRELMFETYLGLAEQAAARKPDLVVLPETAWTSYINDEFISATRDELEQIRQRRFPPNWPLSDVIWRQGFSRRARDAFQELSTDTGVPIVVGSSSLEWKPVGVPPNRVDSYNSAFLFKPGHEKPVARYDKIHLVLFGEYVPFRYKYHSIYLWLNSLAPWGEDGMEYSLAAGDEYDVFEFEASEDRQVIRAGVPICYEEVMPYIARRFVTGGPDAEPVKHIDILLCISNDGWFHHSAELVQHQAAAVFRAVENRVAIARSVNTGASALIDPDGQIHHRVLLTDEQIARLGAVEDALHALEPGAARIVAAAAPGGPIKSLGGEVAAFAELSDRRLKPALSAIGPQFLYLSTRLGVLGASGNFYSQDPKKRTWAGWALGSQIEDDLKTVERWRKRPWTAPGIAVGGLDIDSHLTFYSRFGDRFSQAALALSAIMILDWLIRRVRRKEPEPIEAEAAA